MRRPLATGPQSKAKWSPREGPMLMERNSRLASLAAHTYFPPLEGSL